MYEQTRDRPDRDNGSSRDSGRIFPVVLFGVVILGLGATAAYLMSEINSRKFQIRSFAGHLIIERGQFLPTGFEPYEPEIDELRHAYAPIRLPVPDMEIEPRQFDERAELNRALYELITTWVRSMLQSKDPDALDRIAELVARGKRLPGLSEEQRGALRVMEGDLTLGTGHSLVTRANGLLRNALATFQQAKQLGTSNPLDVDLWISRIERRLAADSEAPLPVELSQLHLAANSPSAKGPVSGQHEGPEEQREDPAGELSTAVPTPDVSAPAPDASAPVPVPEPPEESSTVVPSSGQPDRADRRMEPSDAEVPASAPIRVWQPPAETSPSDHAAPHLGMETRLEHPAQASVPPEGQEWVL